VKGNVPKVQEGLKAAALMPESGTNEKMQLKRGSVCGLNRTSGFPSAVSSLTQDFWLRYTLSSIELEQLSWAF
jgi:hypothetical protein